MVNLNHPMFGSVRDSVVRVGRHVIGRHVRSRKTVRALLQHKFGLEIGGPSSVFGDAGALPLYKFLGGLDNSVFSLETIWEGKRSEGLTFSFHYHKANGFNYIRDATDLLGIPNHHYDFLLSSHCLEHIANPVKALKEWIRVLKPGGYFLVLLPDYRRTFDHRRKPTSVEHMLQDYVFETDETDLTHLQEILALHDLSLDLAAGTKDEFRQRSLRNFENRCLHHHVFDDVNSRLLLETVGLTVQFVELAKPHHVVILAHTQPPSPSASQSSELDRTALPR